MFRHLRAQQLLDEGMALDMLQAYLGHADIGTTRRIYAPRTQLSALKDQVNTFGKSAEETARDALRKQDEETIHTG
jgi:integrase